MGGAQARRQPLLAACHSLPCSTAPPRSRSVVPFPSATGGSVTTVKSLRPMRRGSSRRESRAFGGTRIAGVSNYLCRVAVGLRLSVCDMTTFTFNTLSYNYYKYINTITIPFKYVMRKTLIVYETRLGVPVSHRIHGTCAS